MIVVENVAHRIDGREVLRVDAWRAAAGERWLVLGPSGSGKSTLLHAIAGLLRPAAGRIEVAGRDLGALAGSALDRFRGATIGLVLQALYLVPHLTVCENLRLAQYLAGMPQDAGRIDATLAGLAIGALASRQTSTLSQGERQRAAVARAVVNRPALLLADEPTSSLDDASAERAIALLVEQADAHGATLVVATHDSRVKARFEHRLDLLPAVAGL